MTKKFINSLAIVAAILFIAPSANAFDIKDALGKIAGATGQQQTEQTTTETEPTTSQSTQSSGASGLGSLISSVAGALGFGGNLSMQDLVGTWKYNQPAVQFKSDNFLMQAGGVAASQVVVNKLEPYYKMAGVQNLVLTIDADSTFTMQLKVGKLGGTISQSEDGKQIFFNFAVLKGINIGTMEAFISKKSSSEIEITFDVSGLLAILEKVGQLSQKGTISTVTSLLSQYDGMTAGFDLKKQK
ncbi:MAG: DUF4923 family protein [Muribaculaceae bacterium]|nr:DUF4923 family protein [Muribaculaceae bacterium]